MGVEGEVEIKTFGEILEEALSCETPEQADAWFGNEAGRLALVADKSLSASRDILRQNLIYMAGYCSDEAAAKLRRMFSARR